MGTQLSNRCKTALYRVTYGAPKQSVVYLMDGSRDAAFTRATVVLSPLDGIATEDVCLYNLASFRELVDIGVSDDEDLRIFETGWQGPNVIAWAEPPISDRCPEPAGQMGRTLRGSCAREGKSSH
jgi:hypothetical protein